MRIKAELLYPEFLRVTNDIMPKGLKKVMTSEKETADGLLQSLKDVPSLKIEEIIKGMPVIVSMNGKSYTLMPTEEHDYIEIINTFVAQSLQEVSDTLVEQVKEYASQVQRRIDELNASLSKSYPPPPSLDFVIKNDVQIAVSGETYYFILPFSYRPATLNGRKLDNINKLAKEVLILFGYYISTGGEFLLGTVELRNYDLSQFEHYHSRGMGNDCWGHGNFTIPIGTALPISNLPDLRDRLQNFLENVNGTSIADSNPPKLPNVEHLQVTNEDMIWS